MAFSGEEAIRCFEQGAFDLTLMDAKLPGMNGIEAFLEIRRRRSGTRVIMMTGFSVEALAGDGAWRPRGALANLLSAVSDTPHRAA